MASIPRLKALPKPHEQAFIETARKIREKCLTRQEELPDLPKDLYEKAVALLTAMTDFEEKGFWQAYDALAEDAPHLRGWKEMIIIAASAAPKRREESDERFLTSQSGKRVLKLSTIEDIYNLPDALPLVAGVLEAGSVSMLYGVSGTGKTFTGLDIALSISHGIPCPKCLGTDRFRVRYSRDTGTWSFMCRSCWDAGQYLPKNGRKRGWGDAIDYLRHYREMSFQEAWALVNGQERKTERHKPTQPRSLTSEWQAATHKVMQAHQARLWSQDTLALGYARHRGFYDHIIKQFQLGYSIHQGIPYLVIPSINSGQYVTVYRRDLRLDVPKGQRWKDAPGGTKDELYLADCLWMRKEMPVVLCEDAFSALSIYQECDDLVNVVATGGAECGLLTRWTARLACMPVVLIALDADAAGDKYAEEWGRRLKNARRLRPLLKDANDMLMDSWDLREWVLRGLNEAGDDLRQEERQELPDLLLCSVCGVDAETVPEEEIFSFDEWGRVFCPICWGNNKNNGKLTRYKSQMRR